MLGWADFWFFFIPGFSFGLCLAPVDHLCMSLIYLNVFFLFVDGFIDWIN